jgi:serine/threonine protein phosphatase PrpC
LKESIVWSYQKLEDTFFEIYEEQIKIGNKKIKNVGTCGITAIVHNDRVYVGNSGDSQGIFVLKDGINMFRSLKANNRLSANNRLERERLRK